jgi:uncharacterized protein
MNWRRQDTPDAANGSQSAGASSNPSGRVKARGPEGGPHGGGLGAPEHPRHSTHRPAFALTYVTEEILASHAVEAERIVAQAFLRRLPGDYDVAQAILFGSRARGDHRTDSDLDLAVVLKGRRGDFIDTKLDMAGVAFDVLMETGVLVQPLPLWDDDLAHPERFANPALIRTIVAEGIRLG